ncbi:MAG: PilZ domain-containing protein [Candidatus Omnitrophica bacterium]|nr:PilZ domain-containing protein [Candidatus Omnitrophota bacterium]
MVWQERRSFVRHNVELPVKCRILGEQKEPEPLTLQAGRSNKIKDISEGGLLFFSTERFKTGTLLELTFPVRSKVFTMQGRVVHASRNGQSKLYRTGICFSKADSMFKVKMIEQLHQIEEYRQLLSEEEGRIVSEEEAAQKWIEQHSGEFAEFFR